MIGLGKVRGNLMIDLHTTSTKLRDRAVRIVAEVTQRDTNLLAACSRRTTGIARGAGETLKISISHKRNGSGSCEDRYV